MKCPAFPEPERAIEPLRFLIVRTDRQHNLLDCHVSCVSNAITQQSCSYPRPRIAGITANESI